MVSAEGTSGNGDTLKYPILPGQVLQQTNKWGTDARHSYVVRRHFLAML